MNIFLHFGNLTHLCSFFFLIWEIVRKRDCAGISLKTQLLYLAIFICRYIDIFTNYVSLINTALKIAFICLTLTIIFLISFKYRSTYDSHNDTFWDILLVIPSIILALTVNHEPTTKEVLWTFSIYLEALAILPQYHLFVKTGETRILPYITMLLFYRALYKANWAYRFLEENHVDPISDISGSVQIIILGLIGIHINSRRKSEIKNDKNKVFTIKVDLGNPNEKLYYEGKEKLTG